MAQIKLLSASNEVQWSPEEYVIARTLTIAGGQYVVRERKKTGHVFESDLRPSELMGRGRYRPRSVCPEDDVAAVSSKHHGWYKLVLPSEPTVTWSDELYCNISF